MSEWNNPCPTCGKDRFYSRKAGMDRSIADGHQCKSCKQLGEANSRFGKSPTPEMVAKMLSHMTDERREQARKQLSLVTNRRPHYEIWVDKYGEEEAERRSRAFIQKQSDLRSGEGNPMFGKPAPMGSGNGWSGWYNDNYFRSLHELSFIVGILERYGFSWRSAETNDLRIRYKSPAGAPRNYFADFFVEDQILVEVKPARLWGSLEVAAKREAAVSYCHHHGLAFCLYDPPPLPPQEVYKLWKNGSLRWLPRYEPRFEEWINKHT